MSEDESPATGGQQQQNDADFDANNSIIDKVKSRVSSIFPQTLSKWFSPSSSTTTTTDDNRNGNLRRRRGDDEDDNNEKRRHHHQQNSDDSESDGGGSGSRNDIDLILMPPSKKSRLNYNDDYPIMPPNRNLFASTPMLGGSNRRKNVDHIKNTEIPYNFGTTSTTFISSNLPVGDAREIDDESRYIDDGDVLDVASERRDWTNKKNISSRRSLNIPTTSSFVNSQSPVVYKKNSKIYHNVQQINESENQTTINLDNENVEDDDDIGDVDDDEDDEKINDEIRKAQKQYLSNGLRQSIRLGDVNNSGGGNLNNSTGRISRSGASESDESQCSSLIRQRNNNDKPKSGLFYPNLIGTTTMTTNSQTSSKRTSSLANGLNFYSHLEGKKSLFSEKNMNSILHNSTLSLTSLNRRQQFNASIYGSTSALSDSRLLNTISPFYKGRTTYGGASAYNKYAQLSQQQQRKMRVTPTLIRPTSSLSSSSNNSLIVQDNNQQQQNINNNTVISSTAKRILELMDQFTTPLNEVKKMASGIKVPLSLSPSNNKRFSEADLIASRGGIRLSKPLTPYSRPISLSQQQTQPGQLPPPTSELHVPSMAQLLQLKRLQNNNEKLREIANSSKSILNQREDYKLPNEMNINNNNNNVDNNIGGGKHINKMKNKLTTIRSSNKNQQNEQQILSNINLPNVQLPFMKFVPKIDIKITPPLTKQQSPVKISPQYNNLTNKTLGIFIENLNNDKNQKTSSDIIKYNISPRKPINHKELINTVTKLNGDVGEFIFSSPIQINNNDDHHHQLENINIESINNFKFSPPVAVDSLINKTSNSSTTTNKNKLITDQKELSTSTTISCAVNKNNSEISSSNLLKPTTITTTSPQLKTGSVLDALKKSSTNISNTTTTTLTSSGFGDKFKMSTNKWECSICMIRNDETKNKCVACETPKASTSTEKSIVVVPIPPQINQKKKFGDAFKPTSNSWECDACMVRNQNDVTECIACSTKKPGSMKLLPSGFTTTTTGATTAIKPLDVGFKNIVAQQTTSKWECTACMTRNDSNRTKCICCEQSKPGGNTEVNTSFSFGAASDAAASVSTTSQFKFGFGVDSGAPKEDDLKNKTSIAAAATIISTNKKTDDKTNEGFIFSGQNSGKDFAPSTKALTGFSFGFKTTNESTAVIPSNTVSVSSGSTGGFKFGRAQTTTSTVIENKPITQTKSTTLLVADKIADNKTTTVTTTAAPTINLLNNNNNSGFSLGTQSTSGLKFPAYSPSSTQKLSIENKSENNPPTSSAFKSIGGFSFGGSSSNTAVTINETKSQLFGAVTTTTVADPLKGFVFGSITTTAATALPISTSSIATTTVKKDETLKLFSGFTAPTNKLPEPVKTIAPTIQQSTFSSSNFTFGDSSKNTSTKPSAPAVTTAPSTGFVSGNTSSFVFGIPKTPAPTIYTTPLFGATVQSTAPPIFGNIKTSTVHVPDVSNQQPKPSMFGSTNNNSSNLGFGNNNNNQSTIIPQTQTSTPSIFGSTFSASNLKSPSSIETPAVVPIATTTTVTNQQSSTNLFSFGSAGVKNDTTTTTASIPTLFGNTSSSTTTTHAPNTEFVFGALKPIESTTPQTNSIFGTGMSSNTNNNNNSAFGSTTFGNNNPNSTFGQSQQQQPNANPFGSSSSTNTQQLQTTGFGTPVGTQAFGSSTGTFGSSSNNSGQVQQPFGSSNTSLSFGGFGNNSNRNTGDSSDCPAAKKSAESGFNFGAVAAPQHSNPGFSFGSNNNNNNNNIAKPAFNFSAPVQTPTPSFNFTGANEANSSQPFQFGAPSANIQMPLFNNYIGNESTPNTPFQFNAANNIFAPTPTPGTPSTQQGRRKIRTATRRMNPR